MISRLQLTPPTFTANDIVDKSRLLRYTADTACSAVKIIATPIASRLPGLKSKTFVI